MSTCKLRATLKELYMNLFYTKTFHSVQRGGPDGSTRDVLSRISREGHGITTAVSTKIGLQQARETVLPILSHRIRTRCSS
jgi:hypothetical protein